MTSRRFLLLILLLPVLLGRTAAAAASPPIPASLPHDDPIGRYTSYLKEADGTLTLDEAIAAYARGAFSTGRSHVLNFGIGSRLCENAATIVELSL